MYDPTTNGVFKRTQDLFYSTIARTDQGTLATNDSLLLTVLKTKGKPYHTGSHGEAPALIRRQKKRKVWPKHFIMIFTGRNGQGRVSNREGLELDSLSNFSGLLAIGVIPSCPVPRPGMI